MQRLYFARFQKVGNDWIRHDTRIYLSDFTGTSLQGNCLGAIIGKNPGSAQAAVPEWGALELSGDKMLPNVRNILLEAFDHAGKKPPVDSFVQVLNLFYICGSDLVTATKALAKHKSAYPDPSEFRSFPFVWFAWGKGSRVLDPLKTRFVAMHKNDNAFFYCPQTATVVPRPPKRTELAKHTQGLPHAPLVSYLATRL